MKTITSSSVVILVASTVMLTLSGCALIDQIKGDFVKSADNVSKKAADVKQEIIQTRDSIDKKIQKAENVVNAINDFQTELKK